MGSPVSFRTSSRHSESPVNPATTSFQIGAYAERGFARGLTVVQDFFNCGKLGKLAGLHLERESGHGRI
jgi:hypothetical protein